MDSTGVDDRNSWQGVVAIAGRSQIIVDGAEYAADSAVVNIVELD